VTAPCPILICRLRRTGEANVEDRCAGRNACCANDKIKRALAANGSSLKDAVKMTVYVTDMRNRLDWAKCSGEAFAGVTVPAQTLLGISQLAFPEMMLEIDVTAVAHE
jgi:enamine deaminase RidA (YjgF/YER057c/UK114 family)